MWVFQVEMKVCTLAQCIIVWLAGWLAGNSLIYILHRAAVPQEMSTSVPCDERLPALWVSYMEQGDEKLAQDHRYW